MSRMFVCLCFEPIYVLMSSVFMSRMLMSSVFMSSGFMSRMWLFMCLCGCLCQEFVAVYVNCIWLFMSRIAQYVEVNPIEIELP